MKLTTWLLLCLIPATVLAGEWKVDVVPIDAKISEPFGVDFDQAGAMYVIEYGAHRLIKVKDGKAEVVAGNGQKGFAGDGGPARQSQLNAPHNIAIAPSGDIFIADTNNSRVRKIDAKTGIITTFAGTGKKGFSGDGGAASAADFGNIYCVAFDAKFERMYLADLDNRRIRAIEMKSGIVTTIAGNGRKGAPADGSDAKDQPLVDPRAVAADSKGNVYVLERSGHALRVVDPSGKIKTVAGTGKAGYSGDGGPALQAAMNGPKHLWIDRNDDVLIADTETHTIRKFNVKDGTIELIAGTGKSGSAGVGGPADKCQLFRPHGVFERRDSAMFIADSSNNRILQLESK